MTHSLASALPEAAAPEATPKRAADRIRATARELFYGQGIRAVGVDEIVRCAGVTKPSLYRSFASKDALATDYLRGFDRSFWQRFDEAAAAHPDDPRAQLLAYLRGLGERAQQPGYRGCGLTNAAVEYPAPDHPARAVAVASKQALRARLVDMAGAMGAPDPTALGEGLLLLIEGGYASGQLFGPGGPVRVLADTADALITAALAAPREPHQSEE
jgi:AcrR family transcriptional regulator